MLYALLFMHFLLPSFSLPQLLLASMFAFLHCTVSLPGLCIIYVVAVFFGVVLQQRDSI